jgi:hypothetical protein
MSDYATRVIFISYARADAAQAHRLEQDLQGLGFETWRDTRDIDESQDFTGEIERAMRAATHVIVCLTADVRRRADSFVRREIAYALSQDVARRKARPPARLPLLPVVFPGGELPVLIATWNAIFIDRRETYDNALLRIAERLRKPAAALEPNFADPPALVAYLNALHDFASRRLEESVRAVITLSTVDEPTAKTDAAPAFLFRFATSPVLGSPTTASEAVLLVFPSFDEAMRHHRHRLCLIGEAGAGKSTTLLALARDTAVDRLTDASKPVPTLASLQDWDPDTELATWATPHIPGIEVARFRWLFLLDALDELGRERPVEPARPGGEKYDPRRRCLARIHEELPDVPLVVSCRAEAYGQLVKAASPLPAVRLQQLSDAQMRDYLIARGERPLWEALAGDDALRDLARTPLLLAVLTVAFGVGPGGAPPDIGKLREGRIFDCYIERRFTHEAARPEPLPFGEQETRRLLGWLAASTLLDWRAPGSFEPNYARRVLGEHTSRFLSFAERMHFLRRARDRRWEFLHQKLRDHCAVPVLIKMLRSGDEKKRYAAAHALGEVGDSLAVPPLAAIVQDPHQDPALQVHALAALGAIGSPAAVPAIVAALNGQEDWARYTWYYEMGISTGRDEDYMVRENAADALRRIGEPAIPALTEALASEDMDIRRKAEGALLGIGTTRARASVRRYRKRQSGGIDG